MQVNSLTNPNLQPGQKLYLPQGYAANRSQPAPVQTASVQPPPPASVPADLDAKYRGSYTMRQGDSLYGISRSYGVSVAELQQANGITDARGAEGRRRAARARHGGAPASRCSRSPSIRRRRSRSTSSRQQSPRSPISEHPVGAAADHHQRREHAREQQQPIHAGRDAPATARRPAPFAAGAAAADRRARQRQAALAGSGRIITGFGQRTDGTHNDGINLSVPLGTSVHAAEGGTVAYAGSELKGYGNLILLRHDNGWVTAYAHNDQLVVKRGDKVQRGQVIATAGRSGSVDQPQVHFELRQGSKPVDPVPFLERL